MAVVHKLNWGDGMRKFAVVQRSEYQFFCADEVRANLDLIMLYRDLTEEEVEEIADKMGCRIVWADENGKIWAY